MYVSIFPRLRVGGFSTPVFPPQVTVVITVSLSFFNVSIRSLMHWVRR